MIRPYELMIIIDSKLGEADTESILSKVSDLVRQSGNLGRIDRWGRRKLAFEINKVSEGYYVVFEFAAPPATVAEITRILSITDAVLRHKVIRIPDRIAGRVLAKQVVTKE